MDKQAHWKDVGERLDWIKPFTKVQNTSYDLQDFRIRWYEDGTLNACQNCLDRHLEKRADKTAIIWEPDNPSQDSVKLTYRQLHDRVCKVASGLEKLGVRKGDTVTIYMPMIPEVVIAMLACVRIGAVHSVVFGGFSAESLAHRIEDCGSKVLIAADVGMRGGKEIPLKQTVDEALEMAPVETVIVHQYSGDKPMQAGRDVWFHDVEASGVTDHQPVEVGAEDSMFVLYTSGSTGKPKGVLHTTGGYLAYASYTHQLIFDLQEDDVYWCTADVGWITGHSYSVYGPLANGATIVLFEGVPTYPDASRCWQIVDAHKVSIFYTAPTAIRALMQSGDTPVLETSRKSLRVLGTVGEPINTPAWRWYSQVVGEGRCPIMDTWWQTETGGVLISPLGEAGFHKPGWPQTPLPGIEPALLKSDGSVVKGAGEGALVLVDSWPGQMRSLYKDHDRFLDVYFKPYPGYYFTGDGALRDEAGHYRTTGRLDDVINVSGHRIGTAEIESAFTTHDAVVEAAVVGFPHDIKGEGIYAYLTLLPEYDHSAELEKELIQWVRNRIGPIATADVIHWAPVLPKTRSGKIMRRILRKIASHQEDQIGDTSTLADPGCVKLLIDSRK